MLATSGAPLAGWRVEAGQRSPAATRAAVRRLAALGAAVTSTGERLGSAPLDDRAAVKLTQGAGGPGAVPLTARLLWPPAVDAADAADGPMGEAMAQAITGLMEVHGRDGGRPRRLGLDVASTTAGILAAQGILAAMIARRRGMPAREVRISGLSGALLVLTHHIAAATCADSWTPPAGAAGPGPPFLTADGVTLEIEALTPEAWGRFWRRLGATAADADRGWLPFVFRHSTARCHLPARLHQVTAGLAAAAIVAAGREYGVAVQPLRSYAEVARDPGLAGRDEPVLEPWSGDVAARTPLELPPGGATPLAGFRVVEATSRVQGPLAGQLLRMLGADVMRVEPPGGDPAREMPPMAGSYGASFLAYNRGKDPIEIDYHDPAGRDTLRGLVAGADVFLHNWPVRRAERLGLGPADLRPVNPALVWAHASGWGDGGDADQALATDTLVQAATGCADGATPAGEAPAPTRITVVDAMGALVAAEAVLGALLLREHTARGCTVRTSLRSGARAMQAEILEGVVSGRETGRVRGRPVWGPLELPLETADGFLMVAGAETHLGRLGLTGPAGDSGTAVEGAVMSALRRRGAAEWADILGAAGVPCAHVTGDLAQLPHDPRVSGLLEPVDDACWAPSPPWRFA